MEPPSPRVAVLGGPELDDLRAQLDRIGVEHRDAGRVDFGVRVPLLLSSPERAEDVAAGRGDAPLHLLHVVVCAEAGQRPPADLALLRPLSESLLRQLVRRRDCEDSERRLVTRIAIGVPVKVRADGDQREVVLERISVHGCGLTSPARLRVGTPVEIETPAALTGPRVLCLRGRTRDCRGVETPGGPAFDVSVLFDPLELPDRVTLRALMARHAVDYRPPCSRSGRVPAGLLDRVRRTRAPRADLRLRFQRRVIASCEGHGLVLMGREISHAGMRVERHDLLSEGDSLRLALFEDPGAPPLLLDARFERSEGDAGSFLRFEPPAPETASRLEGLLKSLVPLELDAA